MPKLKIDTKDRVININFVKKGIKNFFESGGRKAVRFFSPGEPTLAFKEMKEIAAYAKELTNDAVEIELQTNGFFNSTVADWIDENVDILWISCDGDITTQNKQRPICGGGLSGDIVLQNIRRFAKNTNMQLGVRSTIAEDDLYNQCELVDFFHSLGVKYMSASPMYSSKPNSIVKKAPILDFAKGFVPAYNRALELGMFYQNLLMVNFDEEVKVYCQSSIPTPRLTPDGYVSCCDWAALGPKYIPNGILSDLLIGAYDEATDEIIYYKDKIENIRRRDVDYLSQSDCKNCIALKHCAGGCVGKIASVTDSIYIMDPDWCNAVIYLYNNIKHNGGLFPVLNP